MRKLQRTEQLLVISACLLALSMLFMIAIIPGILNDPFPKANPEGALIGVSIALILRVLIFLGYLKFIRESRQSSRKRKSEYLAIGILLLILGIVYLDGAFAFLDHENILYVSVLMFASSGCDLVAAVLTISAFVIKPQNAEKKFSLAGVPAWALSLLTFFATLIPLFIIHDYEIPGPPPNAIQITTDFTTFCILVPIACFFICRTFPKSVWYTPVICNMVGFIMCYTYIIEPIFDPNDWITLSDTIIFGSNCVLTITGAIVGARFGRHSEITE